ncbi:MAG: oligosaccharide flippase family protein [Anaerolineae bacterium]|nr:oligosaccharide flippase family protein [Anaerolineae bacterium]
MSNPFTSIRNRYEQFRKILLGRFGQGVMWSVGSLGILAVGGVLMNLIIVRFQGEEALGIFNQVYAIYIVLSQLGVGGLQFSVLKHVSHHQDDRDTCGDITTTALIIALLFSILVCLIVVLLARPVGNLFDSEGVGQGLLFVAPGLLFFTLNKILINTVNGLNDMKSYAVFRALRFTLIPAAIAVIIALKYPAPYLTLSLTVSEFLLFISLSIYVYTKLVPLRRIVDARQWFSEHLSFGARGMLSGILLELNTRVDVLMLGYFTTDARIGIYTFAATLAEGFSQLPLAVRYNVDPVIGKHFAEGATEEITKLSRKTRRTFYPVIVLIGIASILLYPLIFNLLLQDGTTYESWPIYAIIMVGVLINAAFRPFNGTLLQGGKPGAYTGMVLGIVILDALQNLFVIPLWGIRGAAVVTAVTYVLEAVLLIIVTRKLLKVSLI